MALGEPINLRLSQHRREEYEEKAAQRGMPFGAYLRNRLEREDAILDEIAELRGLMVDLLRGFDQVRQSVERTGAGEGPGADPGIALEVLLLLRQESRQDRVNLAQGEVKRQGLTVWTDKKGA